MDADTIHHSCVGARRQPENCNAIILRVKLGGNGNCLSGLVDHRVGANRTRYKNYMDDLDRLWTQMRTLVLITTSRFLVDAIRVKTPRNVANVAELGANLDLSVLSQNDQRHV